MTGESHARRTFFITLAGAVLVASAAAPEGAALRWLADHEAELVAASDRLWETAETAHRERATSGFLQRELRSAGFTVTTGIAELPTAFVASYGSGSPVIGIVALLDALPGLSQRAGATSREPLVEGGAGHGCGHHLIAAADLGAALAIRAAMDSEGLPGTLRLYGAPAEEIYHGGVFMTRAGAFDDVDALFFWHPSSVTLVMGRSGLAMDSLRFVFRGRPSDATDAAAMGRNALSASLDLARRIDAARSEWPDSTVVNYVLLDGGALPSVVPERSVLWVFAHGRDRSEVDGLRGDLAALAERASASTGTSVELQHLAASREWLINRKLAELLQRLLEEEAPTTRSEEERAYAAALRAPFAREGSAIFQGVLPLEVSSDPVPISDDTAEASWVAPRGGFLVASFPAGVPSHTWQWTASGRSSFAHEGMLRATRVLARAALELFTDPDELAAVRHEFEEVTRGEAYRSAMPEERRPFDFLERPER